LCAAAAARHAARTLRREAPSTEQRRFHHKSLDRCLTLVDKSRLLVKETP
jgi:hypothetical protein